MDTREDTTHEGGAGRRTTSSPRYALRTALLTALVALTAVAGCAEKPCESVAATEDVKRLDVLLDGGKLCKDEKGVASIDYPGKDIAAVKKQYEDELGGKGWKTEKNLDSDKLPIVVFAKDSDKVMVTIGKSSDRRVTFAMVKHCPPSGSPIHAPCIDSITKLGDALAKYDD